MKIVVKYLVFLINPLVGMYLKRKRVFILYRFGSAIGDQLCMSAVAKELYKKKEFKIIIFSSYKELFYNNPYVWKNIDIEQYNFLTKKIINNLLDFLNLKYVEKFIFKNKINFEDYMRSSKTRISLIEVHSLHFKIKLDLLNAKPNIFFTKKELELYKDKFKIKKYSIVQPVGKTTYTPNKEWGFDKYQDVVNKTKDDINWIQVGLKQDKLLNNVVDFRGQTRTLRELAFVVKKANFVLANEGLLNHISAAVNTKSFVIFSGFSKIELANYDTTIPISRDPQVKCAPCWLREECPEERKYCTDEISVDIVIQKIYEEEK